MSELLIGNTCVISGAPTNLYASTAFDITGSNSAGSHQVSISLSVNSLTPKLGVLPTTPFGLRTGQQFYLVIPTLADSGVIENCAVSSNVPAGLTMSLEGGFCTLSGSPTSAYSLSILTVTASNSAGSDSVTLNVSVTDDSLQSPSLAVIGGTVHALTLNQPFTLEFENSGGDVDSCVVTPLLPTGLVVREISGTCVISGAPTELYPATSLAITGRNSVGSHQAVVRLSVNSIEPKLGSLPATVFRLRTGQEFYLVIPTLVDSGVIDNCAVSSNAPAGLTISLEEGFCTLSGSPTSAYSLNTLTVTASNSVGSDSVAIDVTVTDDSLQLPSLAAIGGTAHTLTLNQSFALDFENSGGDVDSCVASPLLPTGLVVREIGGTCVISGVPTALYASSSVLVTGSNASGADQVTINLSVTAVAPMLGELPRTPFNIRTDQQFYLVIPTLAGSGVIERCNVSPTLPVGLTLSLESGFCIISGTPTRTYSLDTYSVQASNSAGSDSVSFDLSVVDSSLQPPLFTVVGDGSYTTVLDQFFSVELINNGGEVESCDVTPVLPVGLSLKKIGGTCVIQGVPTQINADETYIVVGTNSAGVSQYRVAITVNEVQPILLQPSVSRYEIDNSQIFYLEIENGQDSGEIDLCEVTPNLPHGLTLGLNNGLCAITGVSESASPLTQYQITGSNTGGSSDVTFDLLVTEVTEYLGDGPDPDLFDHLTVVGELDDPSISSISLRTVFNDLDTALVLQSTGFPNQITQVRTSNNEVFNTPEQIADLFEIFIQPSSGKVEIKLTRVLDYEVDAAFYEIDLLLGSEVKKVLVRLYNLQSGTEDEPLVLSGYDELLSYSTGHFVSDDIGFDEFLLGSFEDNFEQNLAGMHLLLDRDIDASDSNDIPWEPFILTGRLYGGNHVIRNLKVGSNGFIENTETNQFAVISHLGFDNVRMSHRFIRIDHGYIEYVYINGVVNAKRNTTVHVRPMHVAVGTGPSGDTIANVYSNLFIDNTSDSFQLGDNNSQVSY